jgi:hypothetical protein
VPAPGGGLTSLTTSLDALLRQTRGAVTADDLADTHLPTKLQAAGIPDWSTLRTLSTDEILDLFTACDILPPVARLLVAHLDLPARAIDRPPDGASLSLTLRTLHPILESPALVEALGKAGIWTAGALSGTSVAKLDGLCRSVGEVQLAHRLVLLNRVRSLRD